MHEWWLNPVAFQLGPLSIRWYGLAYFFGFIIGCAIMRYYYFPRYRLSLNLLDSVMSSILLGVLIGGRLGFAIFYSWQRILHDPLWVFRIWEGGMAFHGALIGVGAALFWQSRRHQVSFLRLTDGVALCAPIGIFFGRLANFVNGELYGRVTTMPWGIIYPHIDQLPRHPSQLYEALTEGLLLGLLMYWVERTGAPCGRLSAVFLLAYACTRFTMEFFRVPEYPFGLMPFGLDMGQWLSIPMLLLGSYFYYISTQHGNPDKTVRST